MAKPQTASAAKLLILVGDGNSPEVFAAPCGLTTKGIAFRAETNDTTVPECDDPDLPAWSERVVKSLSAGVTGSGVLAAEAIDVWWKFYSLAEARNCRVKIDSPAFANVYYSGRFLLTTFNVTGTIGEKINVQIEMQSDGEVVQVTET